MHPLQNKSKNNQAITRTLEHKMTKLELIGKLGKPDRKTLDISDICLFDYL